MKFDNNIKLSIILYVIICFAIYYIRPPFIFDDKGDFNITPIGRLDLGYTKLDDYKETGINALYYASQRIESGLASFGFEFSDNIQLNEKYKEIVGDIDLSELCIVSKTDINFDKQSDILVETKKASGNKVHIFE